MKIYFACSITGGREFETSYQQIVAALSADGHEIPTSHLAQSETMEAERILNARYIYERDVNWIKECDALIAEVSTPSHGVGYEIAFALSLGKPVLCIHQKGRNVSKMLTGNPHPALIVKSYSNLDEMISQARAFVKEKTYL